MALPPLELFSLKEGAALLPGGSFRFTAVYDQPAGFVTLPGILDT